MRLIVGFAAGGPTDIAGRLIAQWLSQRVGQSFVVENRPGAASNVATEGVARAAPDGYTLLVVSAANAINTSLNERLSFVLGRDIAPVAGIIRVPNVLEVTPSFPANSKVRETAKSLISYISSPAAQKSPTSKGFETR